MTHLKDVSKDKGIRCNRWNTGFISITDNIANVTCKTCKGERGANRVKTVDPDISDVGKVLYTSWGYNMTLVDFCKIIGITDKKVRCVMLGRTVTGDNGRGDGKASPGGEYGKPFLLSKTGSGYFKGSYPFVEGSTRSGFFSVHDREYQYFNSWD